VNTAINFRVLRNAGNFSPSWEMSLSQKGLLHAVRLNNNTPFHYTVKYTCAWLSHTVVAMVTTHPGCTWHQSGFYCHSNGITKLKLYHQMATHPWLRYSWICAKRQGLIWMLWLRGSSGVAHGYYGDWSSAWIWRCVIGRARGCYYKILCGS